MKKRFSYVLTELDKFTKENNLKNNISLKDIKRCYEDEEILDIWEGEKILSDDDDGWTNFEDFLIGYLEQFLIFD